MATRLIGKTWRVEDVLTDATSAKLSDPTGTYGVKRNDTGATVVADGTDMTRSDVGTYEYSFTDVVDVSYTAYVEIVYNEATYHFEHDLPARPDVGEMVASYSSLLERVGHYLFGIRSGYSADQVNDIENAITDGLRDVYSSHNWSFFHPLEQITTVAPYDAGTIEVVDGVVTLTDGTFPSWAANGLVKVDDEYYEVSTRDSDTQITLEDTSIDADAGSSYELSRLEYDLPTGFESIDNHLTYQPGQSDFYPPVEMRDDRHIRAKQQDNPYTDRPLYFSLRTGEFDPTVGSRRRISFYPIADAAYVMTARMTLRPVAIDAVNQYPVGGEMLSQLVLEACLASAERLYDETEGVHTKRFQELLPLAIRDDQLVSSPTQLGPDAPKGQNVDIVSRSVLCGDVSLNGSPL